MADLKAGVTTSFNGGEIAPYLAGRIDHEGFEKCVRKSLNGIPQIGGGMKKFYGTRAVSVMPAAKNYALVPFHHEDSVFLLVLHDGVLDAIIDDNFVSLNIPLPTISDYQSIRYEQANDVLICCSEECTPFRIEYLGYTTSAEASFRIVQIEFDEVPYFPLGYTGNYSGQIEITGVSGTVVARIPDTLQKECLVVSYPSNLSRSSFSMSGRVYRGFRTHESNFNSLTTPDLGNITISLRKIVGEEITVIKSTVVNSYSEGREWTKDDHRVWIGGDYTHYLYWMSNNFSYDSFKNTVLSWFGGALDVQPAIYIPTEEIEEFDSTAVYDIVIEYSGSESNRTTNNDPALASDYSKQMYGINLYGLTMGTEGSSTESLAAITVAASLFSDLNNLVGRKLKIYQNASDTPVVSWYQGMSATMNKTIVYSDGKYYMAKNTGTTRTAQPIHTEGTVSDGGVEWLYLHSGYVTATIVHVKDEHEMTLLLKPGVSLPVSDLEVTTNYFSMYRWSIWGANAIYPSEVFFNNGRLGFFTNSKFGTYYNLSRSDSYYDFAEDSDGEVLDTDAIQGIVTGGSFSNKINWVISRENIYCGSHGTEFVIGGLDGLLTPSTAYCKPVSFTGGDKVAALKYMTLSMFIGAGGNNLNVVNYDYATESYIPLDVSYIAGHLLEGKIKKITGAPRPDNCIYLVTHDGKLVQLVDSVAEKITAFSDMDIGPNVLDVATVFSGNDTDVYVLRAEGESMYVEKFAIANPTYMLSTHSYDAMEGVVEGTLVIPEFANLSVYVKDAVSGQFMQVDVDSEGVLNHPFVTSHLLVGKPMPFIIHGIPSVGKKLEGMQQKSVRFLVRLLESGAFSYGSSHDFEKWYDFNNWTTTDGQFWDAAHRLMTGDIQLPASFGYMQGQNTADGPYPNDTSVALNIRSSTPEPFNLLMVGNIYV